MLMNEFSGGESIPGCPMTGALTELGLYGLTMVDHYPRGISRLLLPANSATTHNALNLGNDVAISYYKPPLLLAT